MEKLFYIQNANAGFLGNSFMWWGLNHQGYTNDLDKAHKFTEAEAKEICERNPKKNVAWPCDYVDESEGIQRQCDCQYLEPSVIHKF